MSKFTDAYGEYSEFVMITNTGELLIGLSESDIKEIKRIHPDDNNVCLDCEDNLITIGRGMDTIFDSYSDALLLRKEDFGVFLKILFNNLEGEA